MRAQMALRVGGIEHGGYQVTCTFLCEGNIFFGRGLRPRVPAAPGRQNAKPVPRPLTSRSQVFGRPWCPAGVSAAARRGALVRRKFAPPGASQKKGVISEFPTKGYPPNLRDVVVLLRFCILPICHHFVWHGGLFLAPGGRNTGQHGVLGI
jgi:hypothetical protein